MKQRKAFTLIEVLLSLMILASCVSILGSSQIRALYRSFKAQEELTHFYPLRKLLYEEHKKKPTPDNPVTLRVKDPEMRVIMSSSKIAQKSSLFPLSKLLVPLQLDADWETARGSFAMNILAFTMKKPATKEGDNEAS